MADKHKTMLLLDEAVWRRFQEEVFRQDGARATSARVEKLIAAADPSPIVEAVAATWPPPRDGFPSVGEVERLRPRARRPVSSLIQEDREDRDDRILGLERPRQTISRRRRK
ncbi:MAG TPA: hypothetical protein VJ400_07605 [Thermoplasmata archaeon]|nr:hypothetical protein [Thermoplasmata archaeon]